MAKDCKVKRCRYEQVGEKARKLRQWLGIDMHYTFDITKQIEQLVGQTFGALGVLHLDLFEQDNEDLAFVTFNPKLTLHAHQEIWDLARMGGAKVSLHSRA